MQTNSETSILLDLIKTQLNSEFIGLEHIIDQFIDAVTPWCTMSESQTRPLVVNLWGMTGVGKTSLVKRFLTLWNEMESVILFNMGSKSYSRDLLNSMESMSPLDGKPCVIIFDEFQHAKTIEESGKELENPVDRMIWQLLDDGKYLYTNGWYGSDDLIELITGLGLCLEKGVKVEKGKVVQGWQLYKDIMSIEELSTKFGDTGERSFLTFSQIKLLFNLVKPEFKYKSLFNDYIFQLNGEEILKLVVQIEKKSCVAQAMDFSKSLILVIGNLDEAFDMSANVSADYDPDLFYEESKKITFSKIKEGLKDRFRMEEIARLGNIHLIYPSLSSQVFRDFINKELKEIAVKFQNFFGFSIEFSSAVKNMLFEEGVTATQGFRPLRSTISYLIESSLAILFQKTIFNPSQRVIVDLQGDDLLIMSNGLVEGRKTLYLPVREAKRKKMNSEALAITAVHEAGHILVYGAVFGKLPKFATITSSDFYTGGFVAGDSILDFDSYDMIIREIIVKMAGKKAEELVFGKEHQITFGCKNDIRSSTRILVDAVRSGVLSGVDMFFENPTHGFGNYLPETAVELTWVKEELEKASKEAERILKENQITYQIIIKVLLDKMTVSSTELSEELTKAGANLQQLFQAYPLPVDFISKLESFLETDLSS